MRFSPISCLPSMMLKGLYTIPAGAPFADFLARGLVQELGATHDPLSLASVTLYLPTRRAVRTVTEAFARNMGGAALLPQIRALGDVDEEDLIFDPATDDFDLLPSIEPLRRRLLLATLVQRWAERRRESRPGLVQSSALARQLARFLDEIETSNADLARLNDLVPPSLAEHWADVRDFLFFLAEAWPSILDAENAIDPAVRRNLAMARLTLNYRELAPTSLVVAAGTTGSIPATAELLSVIAQLPKGAVVLPGLDRDLDAASWDALTPVHAQFGMKQLLARIGGERSDVRDWPGSGAARGPRAALLREALRPAPTTDAWRALADCGASEIETGLDGISLVTAAHPAEEALAIALMLREAIDVPDRSAALVTPDRNLARRVAAELRRWNIVIDDSAGVPLANTPPAVFLSLLGEAAADFFSPVALLALLKHPLAAASAQPGEFRRSVRALDRFVLRGPRPDPGLAGIAKAIANSRADADESGRVALLAELASWFGALTNMLEELASAMNMRAMSLPKLVELLQTAGERLATTDTEEGNDRLWRGEAGNAAAELIEQLKRAGADLIDIEPRAFPTLFRNLAEERAVRPAHGRHPRLAILGPLEARLQHFDLIVLGGLNEGTWPAAAQADPWLSRPMREALGLESPERAVGLSAHDFATLAAHPQLRLTRSAKVDGTPTVASRWVQRLEQLTRGLKLNPRLKTAQPFSVYAMHLATPDCAAESAPRPEPRPPVSRRPRALSVTQIETWLRDPYAIYARHVLRLKPIDPLDAEIGPMDRGSAMHEILERFIRESNEKFPSNAAARLIGISEEIFAAHGVPQSTLALWRPRFARAAAWFVQHEHSRRERIAHSFLEVSGRIAIDAPGGTFMLTARADRLDELRSGGAVIIDYKTGKPPTDSQVGAFASQLPLEGAILERGGFQGVEALAPVELVYLRFSGGDPPGDSHVVKGDPRQIVANTYYNLVRLISEFDREETAYPSRVAPFSKTHAGDYDHLARVREWSLSGWEGA